jgi:hypothetical protein
MAIYSCIYPNGYTLTSAETALYGTRAYTSMKAWENARNGVLTDDEICHILPGDDTYNWSSGADTSAVTFAGWRCGSYKIKIIALDGANYAYGDYSSSRYRLEVKGTPITISNRTSSGYAIHLNIYNVQIYNTSTSSGSALSWGYGHNEGDYVYFYNSYIRSGYTGIYLSGGATQQRLKWCFYNCNIVGTFKSDGIVAYNNLYNNCDFVHCNITKFNVGVGGSAYSNKRFINCNIFNNKTADHNSGAGYFENCSTDDFITGTSVINRIDISPSSDTGALGTIKFWTKGAGTYTNDGEFFVIDTSGNYYMWQFSYTTSYTEVTLDFNSPTWTSGTMNWGAIQYYKVDLNTTGRTVYIDDIRFYDINGTIIHQNTCESTAKWSCVNGTLTRDSANEYSGTYCIKIVSSANDCYSHYNMTSVNWEIFHEAKSWSKSFSDVYYNRYWLPDANAYTYDKGVASSSLSDAVILSSDIRGNHRPQRINPSTGPFEWGYNSNMSGNPLSLLLL